MSKEADMFELDLDANAVYTIYEGMSSIEERVVILRTSNVDDVVLSLTPTGVLYDRVFKYHPYVNSVIRLSNRVPAFVELSFNVQFRDQGCHQKA